MRISLSCWFMIPHYLPTKTDGARCVDLFEISACSDSMTILVALQNANTINHMRQTEGGAFPLPSSVAGSQGPTSEPTDSRYSRRFATNCSSGHAVDPPIAPARTRRLVADSLRRAAATWQLTCEAPTVCERSELLR
jgi:hypothetical protein